MVFRVFAAAIVALLLFQAITWALTDKQPVQAAADHSVNLIPIASKDEVLALVRDGKRVVFVDAREAPEFEEEHIPGAINLPLRDINQLTPDVIKDANLVVGYCLKDFRGYEVAKALAHVGVKNVVTLEKPGINGWKAYGLPIYKQGETEAAAVAQLKACAEQGGQCAAANGG
ncbi:MAG: rhodanese-like domain-containing protein [Gammaproteobacteria bacterium]|nr:rhodanese-like domain-containing protein [Gammaproteobacteria bacterium]